MGGKLNATIQQFINYIRIENAHIVRKKTFYFLVCAEVQQIFIFPFSAETLSNT